MSQGHLILGVFLQMSGVHYAAWRHPSARPDLTLSLRYYQDMVQTLEAGQLDFVFCADSLSILHKGNAKTDIDAAWVRKEPQRVLEPLTLLSAIAPSTRNIGLVCTASTTYSEPYNLARMFASFDFISEGRSGWNIVTGSRSSEASNFGDDAHPSTDQRYERAAEFIEVAKKLWFSMEGSQFLRDKQSGVYLHSSAFRNIAHKGKYFSIAGPLNVPRPPQGYPVLFQAGSSGPGLAFAANAAEVVFSAQIGLEEARSSYGDLKRRIANDGRSPADVKLLPGLVPIIGRTRAEAEDKFDVLRSLIDPKLGLLLLSEKLGDLDLSNFDVDGPLPDTLPASSFMSRLNLIAGRAKSENMTIRQLYEWVCASNGHGIAIGSASDVADQMEEWFTSSAADGFVLIPPLLPIGCDEIVNLLVPELQKRGLFRHAYSGRTLRDNLNLSTPS